jgi:WD40 repeat protein/class 3 adenylate cyclase
MVERGGLGTAARAEILTFLIADVRGYTSFTQARGDEAAARLAATFAEIAREGVEARGGSVIELRGDEALAVFGSARQALRAAVDLQLAFVDEVERDPTVPLRVGIGLDAGEAVPVEDGYRGGALNLAARLCSQAGPGQVLASQGVLHLARAVDGLDFTGAGVREMKGLPEPVAVFDVTPQGSTPGDLLIRLDDAGRDDAGPPPRTELPPALDPSVPLIGREVEARWLRWTWRQARRGSGAVAAIVGPAGAGKTRLAADVAALAAMNGAGVTYVSCATGSEAVPAIDAASAAGPAVIVIDDAHAADAATNAALSRLVDRSSTLPVFAVIAFQAEAGSGPWFAARPEAVSVLRLEPLPADAVRQIAALYLDDPAIPAPVAALLEASEGLPARIHALAGDWARGEAARRLGEAAAQAATQRSGLRSWEATLADNVVDLQLVRERSELYSASGSAAEVDGRHTSPYRGLESFDVGDAPFFFGRERLVAEMIGRLAGSTALGVVGPSGSGKSSAVRAGLLSALGGGALPGSEGWATAVLRPGAYPLRALDRAVWSALPDTVRARLEGSELPLRMARAAMHEGDTLVVLVDQFEELFTQCTDEQEREAFVNALVEATVDPRANAIVVVGIRADFYGRCAAYPAFAELLGASHVLVGPMSAGEYARTITGPARRSGLVVEPALVDALVAEVVDEPGGLPLLSSALFELWQHRNGRTVPLEAYERTGGIHGAVGRLAEEAYDTLSAEEQDVARAVMLRLAGPGDGSDVVRRRVPVEELDLERNERVARVVRALTDARLLTVSEGALEVAHEALLREWPRFRAWLDEDRSGQRLRSHLTEQAKAWEEAGREAGELYRGARLASAIDWTAEHNLELNELEREFLAQSREARERELARQRTINRRLRAMLATVALFLVLALIGAVLAVTQRGKAEAAATEADAQRLGAQALVQQDLDLSLLLARQGTALHDSEETRANLQSALVRSPAAIAVWRPVSGRPQNVTASPDGRLLAVGNNRGEVGIVDATSGELLRTMPGFVGEWNAVGELLVPNFTPEDGLVVRLVDPTTGDTIREVSFPQEEFAAFSFSEDLGELVIIREDGVVRMWDPATDRTIAEIPPRPGRLFLDVWLFGDGRLLTIEGSSTVDDPFSGPGFYTLWEPGGAEPTVTVRTPSLMQFAVTEALDRMAQPQPDGSLRVYDLETGVGRTLEGRHLDAVFAAFTPDGRTLATTSEDGTVGLWDTDAGVLREVLVGHNGPTHFASFADVDGRVTMYTSSLDGSVMAWDVSGERRLGRPFDASAGYPNEEEPQAFLALSPDGSMLAAGDADGAVVVRDTETFEMIHELDAIDGEVDDLAFSPDGSLLAVTGPGQVGLWETGSWIRRPVDTSEVPLELDSQGGINWVRAVSFSPDGETLIAGGPDGLVRAWDAATGEVVGEPVEVGGDIFDVAFDPDGRRLVVAWNGERPDGGFGGWATVYSFPGGDEVYTVNVEGDGRAAAALFSPDGAMLATGGGDGLVKIFDAASGDRMGQPILASAGFVLSLDFDPSGRTLVSGGTDGTIRLLDPVTTRQLGAAFPTRAQRWVGAVVTPDGNHVLAVLQTGEGVRWSIDPRDWNRHACAVAGRTLTRLEWDRFLPDRPYEPACG